MLFLIQSIIKGPLKAQWKCKFPACHSHRLKSVSGVHEDQELKLGVISNEHYSSQLLHALYCAALISLATGAVSTVYWMWIVSRFLDLEKMTSSSTWRETKHARDYTLLLIKDSWVANSYLILKKNSTQRQVAVQIIMRIAKTEEKLSSSVVRFSPYAAAPVGILAA